MIETNGLLVVVPLQVTEPGVLISSNVDDSADPAAYSSGTTYAAAERCSLDGVIYQSLAAGNVGHPPATSPEHWIKVGAINRLKMFDGRVGAQTVRADSIEGELQPGAVVDVVAFRNLEALAVTVEQSTAEDGVLYSKTVDLDEPVGDWYEYFFNEVQLTPDAVFTGLLPFTDAVISFRIESVGGTPRCGEMIVGPAMQPGITQLGLSDGIDDYSLVAPDGFGVYDIVERDYADVMELTVFVASDVSPAFRRLLAANRARPVLVVGSQQRPDAMVYGLVENWRRTLSYPQHDVFTISMKGLT